MRSDRERVVPDLTKVLIPPVVTAAAIGIQRAVHRWTPSSHSTSSASARTLSTSLRGASAMLGLAAVGVMATASVQFWQHHTTIDPRHPDRTRVLNHTGIYALSRNPIYLADLLFVAAHGIHTTRARSVLPLAGAWLWFDRVQVPREETALRARFGAEYADYQNRTPRWA